MAVMGADGPAIFSDDFACDVRDDYRALLEDQVTDTEATQQIISANTDLDVDEEPVFWLALAATQWRLGRLEDSVRARALDVIDSGRDLARWEEAGPRAVAKRAAALAALREQLTSPQPARKPIRRPWRYVTDLDAGAVLAYQTSGPLVLLRVARILDDGMGTVPVVERLAWDSEQAPTADQLTDLAAMRDAGLQGPSTLMRLTKHRRRDLDWSDAGFRLVGKTPLRPEDADVLPILYSSWDRLQDTLERDVKDRILER
jgi:hypothetical protein